MYCPGICLAVMACLVNKKFESNLQVLFCMLHIKTFLLKILRCHPIFYAFAFEFAFTIVFLLDIVQQILCFDHYY